jgi:hypothetical protein
LEGAKQLAKEGAFIREDQHFSLNECALGVVVLQDDILFQAFHGKELIPGL